MDERDREQEQEMLKQVHRYEQSKQNNENAWFDSDNYADIIDWYYMHNKEQQAREVVLEDIICILTTKILFRAM